MYVLFWHAEFFAEGGGVEDHVAYATNVDLGCERFGDVFFDPLGDASGVTGPCRFWARNGDRVGEVWILLGDGLQEFRIENIFLVSEAPDEVHWAHVAFFELVIEHADEWRNAGSCCDEDGFFLSSFIELKHAKWTEHRDRGAFWNGCEPRCSASSWHELDACFDHILLIGRRHDGVGAEKNFWISVFDTNVRKLSCAEHEFGGIHEFEVKFEDIVEELDSLFKNGRDDNSWHYRRD